MVVAKSRRELCAFIADSIHTIVHGQSRTTISAVSRLTIVWETVVRELTPIASHIDKLEASNR